MNKCSFYSLMYKNGKTAAVLHHGYSDGTFYYYNSGKKYPYWEVIHPLFGLSVTYGYTRKEAAEKAHAPALLNRIAEESKKRGKALAEQFNKAWKENRIEEKEMDDRHALRKQTVTQTHHTTTEERLLLHYNR